MPKVSRETALDVRDFGVAEDRTGEFESYTVNFVTIRQDHDLAPLLKGLPGDSCQCPHWGYVLKGRLTWRFDDREEVFEAGDAFYVPPGHAPRAEAGSEFVQFSPSQELHASEAAMMENLRLEPPA
jgi:mannose-6-phosphate isomerase-like protein (cupin superfamily)